jgi:EmrB/QacA subfamily drug resistance transporter
VPQAARAALPTKKGGSPVSRALPESEDLRGTWLVLIMASIGMTVVAYNTTAVITILPNLQSEFDLRPTTLQWVMTIYTVSAAALVPVMGRLGDQVGKMPVYLFGIAAFALGALVVALAGSAFVLLAGRLGQGIGAASLFGTSLAVLSAATPESHRSFVMGFWGAMMALGMSLGPIIGGSFAELISWRGIFVSDLVLSAICLGIAIRVTRAGYVPDAQKGGARFDYAGAVALVLLLGPLAYALTHGESQDWISAATLVPLGVALAAAIAFWVIEHRVRDPLIHLRYFRHPRFFMSTVGILIAGFLLLGFLVYFNLFVQSPDTLALSPVLAGAALLPLTAVMFVFSVTAPRILAPYNFHWPVTIGMTCLTIACLLLYGTSDTSTYASIWWKLIILGIGFGLTTPLLPRVGLRLLPEEHTGQGSGLINTCLYFGGSLGVVVCGLVAALTVRGHVAAVVAVLPADLPDRDAVVASLTHGSPTEVQQTLFTLAPSTGSALQETLRGVQDDVFDAVMLTCALVALAGGLLAGWLLRGPVPPPHSAASLARREG